jgi:soluble lytic murein transglycosylase-like protein
MRLSVAILLTSFVVGLSANATAAVPASVKAEAAYYADVYADHYGVPRELVHAIITQESGWNPQAISNKGALGLMQLMPGTAADFGVMDPFSIPDNIGGGVRYLAALMNEFQGEIRLVVAAYYCGSKYPSEHGLAYSNSDVVAYVRSVRALYTQELEASSLVAGSERGNR